MRAQLAAVTLAAVLSACGGGAVGGSNAPVAPIAGATATPVPTASPVPTATPSNSATFPLNVAVPNRSSSLAREPRGFSPGTASVVVYDGTTVLYVGNFNPASTTPFTTVFAKAGTTTVTGGNCVPGASSATCTFTVTTTIGAHTYDVVTYSLSQTTQAQSAGRTPSDVGTLPSSYRGVVLSEGELAVTLVAGLNPGQTITLLGVADQVAFTGPVLTQRLNGTGALVGVIGTQYTFTYAIDDASANQIVLPGNYDNGPVTIAETDGGNIVTMTPISATAPPASPGVQSFTVTCAANGTATITAGAKNAPNTAYASGLVYTSSNYATATLGTATLQCVPNSATLPVTVQ